MSKEKKKEDLYEIYEKIKKSNLSFERKKIILRSLLSVEEELSWRVVAISHEAVVAYAKNGFKPTKNLERHHPIAFAETADTMLSDEENLTCSEWFDLIEENEKTHLITKEEHRKSRKSCNYKKYDILSDLKLFKNKYIGWEYGEKEKEFLMKLVKEKNINTES